MQGTAITVRSMKTVPKKWSVGWGRSQIGLKTSEWGVTLQTKILLRVFSLFYQSCMVAAAPTNHFEVHPAALLPGQGALWRFIFSSACGWQGLLTLCHSHLDFSYFPKSVKNKTLSFYSSIFLAALGLSCGVRDVYCHVGDLQLRQAGSSSVTRERNQVPCIVTTEPYPRNHQGNSKNNTLFAAATAAKSLQSCPTLCDPRDGSPRGSPFPGILQARTPEWVAISFSNG